MLCEKHQKSPFFRPSDPFVRVDALNLGSKFEYYLTKSRSVRMRNEMMPETSCQMHQVGAVSKDDAVKHQTMVASHTETPLGVSKWLERNSPLRI